MPPEHMPLVRAAVPEGLCRQYLYFCTSKADSSGSAEFLEFVPPEHMPLVRAAVPEVSGAPVQSFFCVHTHAHIGA